jgi:hypothetical protein
VVEPPPDEDPKAKKGASAAKKGDPKKKGAEEESVPPTPPPDVPGWEELAAMLGDLCRRSRAYAEWRAAVKVHMQLACDSICTRMA